METARTIRTGRRMLETQAIRADLLRRYTEAAAAHDAAVIEHLEARAEAENRETVILAEGAALAGMSKRDLARKIANRPDVGVYLNRENCWRIKRAALMNEFAAVE